MKDREVILVFVALVGIFIVFGIAIHHTEQMADTNESLQLCLSQLDTCKSLCTSPPLNYKGVFETTAYTAADGHPWDDGRSALLYPAARGLIAADWRIFPPGTVLFIDGYGYGVVMDKGGAIKGKRLDLFFEEERSAREWGRRPVKVWVIGRIEVSARRGRSVR